MRHQQECETPAPVYVGIKLQNAGFCLHWSVTELWTMTADHRSSNEGFWTICPWLRCSSTWHAEICFYNCWCWPSQTQVRQWKLRCEHCQIGTKSQSEQNKIALAYSYTIVPPIELRNADIYLALSGTIIIYNEARHNSCQRWNSLFKTWSNTSYWSRSTTLQHTQATAMAVSIE